MLRALVAEGSFPNTNCMSEHGGVLARAIVVEPCRMEPGISQQLRATLRQRLVRAAGQVPFLETDRFEHVCGNCDVLGLSRVGCARQGQLIVSPADRVRDARCDDRRRLHRLGT
jgi:hypothetical protein